MKDKIPVDRLCASIQRSRRDTEFYRINTAAMVEQTAGPYWSGGEARQPKPLNLLALYHQIMLRTLVPKSPRVMLSTFNRQYKPTVRALQDWANEQIDLIDFAATIRKCASNALYCVGIAKVALTSTAESALSGWEVPAGMPTITSIDLDDFFFDTTARDFKQAGFIGHRYRVPREAAIKMLGKRAKDLAADEDKQFNEQGDYRIGFLGRPNNASAGENEFEDMVTLWEVYLPRQRRILTLSDSQCTGMGSDYEHEEDFEPLLDQPWVGPCCGPYHFLGFQWVNGNPMPKGMIPDLVDLDRAVNESMRKIMRVVDRMKEIGLVEATASEDGKNIVEANDGDMVKVQGMGKIQQMVFSGQHLPPIHAMTVYMKDLFSFMGGNLELLGGRSPQAKTAAQDKMLNENAGVGVADLQDATLAFASDVLESWLWFHHHDPYTIQRSTHPIRKGRDIVREVYPNQPKYTDPENKEFKGRPLHVRGAKFEEMQVRVDPYSMQHQTPQSRLNFLIQFIQNVFAPVLPLAQQQGISIDWNTVFNKVGEFSDNPDLSEILTIMDAPSEGPAAPEKPGMPANTNREYTRHNVSEQTNESANRNMITSSLGINTGGNKNTAKSGAA